MLCFFYTTKVIATFANRLKKKLEIAVFYVNGDWFIMVVFSKLMATAWFFTLLLASGLFHHLVIQCKWLHKFAFVLVFRKHLHQIQNVPLHNNCNPSPFQRLSHPLKYHLHRLLQRPLLVTHHHLSLHLSTPWSLSYFFFSIK